jgi:hypothetical protein
MNDRLSIGADDGDWQVFGKTPPGKNEVLFRSRAADPMVRAYALENEMMRVRCALRPDQVRNDGMPKSTKDLDDYEDRLLGALGAANAEVHLIAVVTGDGNRDLYFAARDLDELRAGIKAAKTDVDSFSLQLAPIGDKEPFLKMLSLSPEQQRAAMAKQQPAGGLMGKLFGR